jgi:hypothetical protein
MLMECLSYRFRLWDFTTVKNKVDSLKRQFDRCSRGHATWVNNEVYASSVNWDRIRSAPVVEPARVMEPASVREAAPVRQVLVAPPLAPSVRFVPAAYASAAHAP